MPIIDGAAQGLYAAQGDVQDIFGATNIALWSQLDPTQPAGTADVNRIQRGLDYADATIISTFLNYGNYAVPLEPQGSDVVLVTRWGATLAGVWLYDSRGQRDVAAHGQPAPLHKYEMMRRAVIAEMCGYRGSNKLNATRRWPTPTAPAAT